MALVEPAHPQISLARQAELLDISRSSLYYQPIVSPDKRVIMEAIDRIYTKYPFYGSRRMKLALFDCDQLIVNRKRVCCLMKEMGLEAVYPKAKKNLSQSNPAHQIFPYLLTNLLIIRPNQVWGTDITYIKTEDGWAYLIAILDWFSRYVINWRLSNNLELAFCIEAIKEALSKHHPEIINSDQGSQFTSQEFTQTILRNEVKISMDGRGRCMDNIFTERLWRTVKYENVYLKSYRNLNEAKIGLKEYFYFYNYERRHQSLNYQTPASIYYH